MIRRFMRETSTVELRERNSRAKTLHLGLPTPASVNMSRQIAFLDEIVVDKGRLADSSSDQIDGHQIPNTTASQEDNVTSCQAFLNFLRVGSREPVELPVYRVIGVGRNEVRAVIADR